MLPDSSCVSFNKAPIIEDFPLPLLPTITVKSPVFRGIERERKMRQISII